MLGKGLRFIGEYIEELFLIGIILLNVLDFLEIINPDLDYIKKVVSFTALCFLLYRASFSKIISGINNRVADLFIVLAYLLFSVKNIVSYSHVAITEMAHKGASYWAQIRPIERVMDDAVVYKVTTPLQNISVEKISSIPVAEALDNLTRIFTIDLPLKANDVVLSVSNNVGSANFLVTPKFLIHRWHNLVLDNMYSIQEYSIIAGLMIFLAVAFFLALKKAESPSIMTVIGANVNSVTTRSLIYFTTFIFLYVALINLFIEWLALAIDAPLIISAIFFYLLVWIKYHKRFSTDSIIFKVGNFGEEFFEKFLSLLTSKKGLMLVLSGMLVMHLLTDMGVFLVPYTVGIHDPLYFMELDEEHSPIFNLAGILSEGDSRVGTDIEKLSNFKDKITLIIIYLANLLAAYMLFIGPAFIWFMMLNDKGIRISGLFLSVFFFCVSVFLLIPALSIEQIESDNTVGVDVVTKSVLTSESNLMMYLIIPIIVGLIVFFLSRRYIEKVLLIAVIAVLVYFAEYLLNFFLDVIDYYIRVIPGAIASGQVVLALFFSMLLLFTAVFYIGAFVSFVYESLRN